MTVAIVTGASSGIGRVTALRLARDYGVKDGGALGIWRQWAQSAHGQAMKGGHFFPEENPDDTAVLVKQFLAMS